MANACPATSAVTQLERALAAGQKSLDALGISWTEILLAEALWRSGGDRRRARQLAERAREANHSVPDELPRKRYITEWQLAQLDR